MRIAALLPALLTLAAPVPAQQIDDKQVRKGLSSISSSDTVKTVKQLAGDEFEGRNAGYPGCWEAAEWIAERDAEGPVLLVSVRSTDRPIGLVLLFEEAVADVTDVRLGYLLAEERFKAAREPQERISALEGGVGAIATASGQAALHLAIATLMGAGSHIVSSQSLYGGTHNLLAYTLPRFGIETTFVDGRDPQAFAAAIRDNTRLVFAETLGNRVLKKG